MSLEHASDFCREKGISLKLLCSTWDLCMRDNNHLLNCIHLILCSHRKTESPIYPKLVRMEVKMSENRSLKSSTLITLAYRRFLLKWNVNNKYSMACNDTGMGQGHLTNLSGHSNSTSELDILPSRQAHHSARRRCLKISPVKIETLK